MGLPVPYGCALEDIQAEAEKAMRELSSISGSIAVNLPKKKVAPVGAVPRDPRTSRSRQRSFRA